MPEPSNEASTRLPTIVFDVNETLLDCNVLAPVFNRIFGDAGMLRTWFNQVVLYAEALTLAGEYADSGAVGLAVLHMLADIAGVNVDAGDLGDIKRLSAAMPTYADTPPALKLLRHAGFRLTTLSNNPTAGVEMQLTAAGLRLFFDQLHSIDDRVRRYKPARESYQSLANTIGIAASGCWLVSCHAFDTLGAAAAGCRTALILRPGNASISLGKQPDIIGNDLRFIAARIIAAPRGRTPI
jgi:2-haloacid dehalogenase